LTLELVIIHTGFKFKDAKPSIWQDRPPLDLPEHEGPVTSVAPRVYPSGCGVEGPRYDEPRRSLWQSLAAAGGRDQPKAAFMNRVRDYQALEREYITGTMSLRELCRLHGVIAHSAVMVQARKGGWTGKRDAYRTRATSSFIEHHADRAAAREAEVRDHALEAIDEAITRFRADLRATERKLVGGAWVEVLLVRVGPRDLALLIDRFQVLFDRPSSISEGRAFSATVTTEALPIDDLRRIVELTRRIGGPRPGHSSPLPDYREKRPD
jgi:hypothetical protein